MTFALVSLTPRTVCEGRRTVGLHQKAYERFVVGILLLMESPLPAWRHLLPSGLLMRTGRTHGLIMEVEAEVFLASAAPGRASTRALRDGFEMRVN